ncbi:hypothetical protein DR66_3824 [Delftia acidovorans]|nr:DHCW motif cupin fold protein [Delftia acidovorans]KFJ12969.1 hypothetical protein DR66_3824 [Delftia acidovorans]QQB53178.1 DHCW motif cupin fold protein [Delftia acidovorans]
MNRKLNSAQAGQAFWLTQHFGEIRVCTVEYTPGYGLDHWCSKGHILFCIEGELVTELEDGRRFTTHCSRSWRACRCRLCSG